MGSAGVEADACSPGCSLKMVSIAFNTCIFTDVSRCFFWINPGSRVAESKETAF